MGKPDTLIVRAANPEKPVFMPGHPLRQFDSRGFDKWAIRADAPREVPNDVYYRRQVRDGDLVELQGEELRAFQRKAAAELAAQNAPPAAAATVRTGKEE